MEVFALIGCGAASGVLAGMLGIGGGLIVVPVLYAVLRAHDVDASLIPHIAVATSLAAMIPTSLAASLAQARRGALDASWMRRLAPGVAAGAASGALLAGSINGTAVSLAFVVYACCFAAKLLRRTEAAAPAAPATQARALAAASRAAALPVGLVGAFIGMSSAVAGIGGALLTVPYLLNRALDMQRAVAGSSAVSFVIALAATSANVLQEGGGAAPDRLPMLGSVYWPAALVIGAIALLCAPCGVAWSHRMPIVLLRRVFALLTLAGAAGTLAGVLR